jgi:hypothetical protein
MDRETKREAVYQEAAVTSAIEKCLKTNQQSVYICLPSHATNEDQVEILPGIKADVLVHGQKGGHGLQYMPTIAVVKCGDLKIYMENKESEQCHTSQTKLKILMPMLFRNSASIARRKQAIS